MNLCARSGNLYATPEVHIMCWLRTIKALCNNDPPTFTQFFSHVVNCNPPTFTNFFFSHG